jgi:putative ABC transport system permease protein
VSALIDDIRFGTRTFRHSPGFSVVVITTLGVGIAAATLVFSLVNAVLYRPYDRYPWPDRLVLLLEENRRLGATALASGRAIAEWKGSARSFERLGGMDARRVTLAGGADPESVFGLDVTEDVLPMLGARVDVGHAFAAGDHLAGAPPVTLLGHRLWQRRFAGDARIAGRSVTINGRPHTVVGVLSADFTVLPFFGAEPDLVTPLAPAVAGDRSVRTVFAVGRLRPAATIAQASAEMRTIAAAAAASDPAARGWEVTARMARGLDVSGDAGFIVVLAVGVGFVLLIVCANVANLLLCRATSRSREIATRLAIGAGRIRIARQLLTESIMLAVAGSLAGLCISYWVCRGTSWLLADTSVALLDLSLDARVAAFAVVVSGVSALAAGLAPSIRLSRTPVIDLLKEHTASIGPVSPGRLRGLLVATEVALALVLLVGCGLSLQGLANLRHTDPGFRPEGLSSVSVTLSDDRYAKAQPKADYVADALRRLEGHREVQAAATSFLPAIGGDLPAQGFTVEGRAKDTRTAPSAGAASVSPAFFRTMGIPLRAGRAFEAADRAGSLPVAIVNGRLVEKWFAGRSPIGAHVEVFGQVRTIVGVVGDVRNFHLNVSPAPTIYLPYEQHPSQSVAFVLRTDGDQAAVVAMAKAELRAIDRDQVIRGGNSFEQLIARSLGGFNLTTVVVGLLAAVAFGLAAMGLYAVIAYSVARRTREIGIRLALGAGPGRVSREVVGQGLRLALAGSLPGLLLAIAVGKLLSSKLHGVSALDPAILTGASMLVLAMVLLASYLPARRAARVDPAITTRTV